MNSSYIDKFNAFKDKTLFPSLSEKQQAFVRAAAIEHLLTFQELRQITEACRDLHMWQEGNLETWWRSRRNVSTLAGKQLKKKLLADLNQHLLEARRKAKSYPQGGLTKPTVREKKNVTQEQSPKTIAGLCPVASEETVCCNLRTIDAVENCAFGCSYCTIQTFYNDKFVFDADIAAKLKNISLDPNRHYHYGSGQSSDSLVWGNKYGNLDALCQWAADNPNVLLEFKTKSDNISYLLENEIPPNIVCSWSLNTPTIVQNEEHFTADLDERIKSARAVADKGIKVSFHFHPMVYYDDWQLDYPRIAERLVNEFDTREVLFISFGSVTMIKPAMKKIRNNGLATKILQMELVPDPHGKLTYPDDIKVVMFKTMYEAFSKWHGQIFFYLCMEKSAIWKRTFGTVYENNELFEEDFLIHSMKKIHTNKIIQKPQRHRGREVVFT